MLLAEVNPALQTLTVLGGLISVLSFVGLVRYGSRFLRSETIRAQLEEKNEIIKTHEQNIDALEKRLSIFEDEIRALTAQVDKASTQIALLQSQLEEASKNYEGLEKYSAPAAFEILNQRFDNQEILLNRILSFNENSTVS